MGPIGAAAGRLHDLGKYVSGFQDHIAGRSKTARGPDHSSAGAVDGRNRLGHPLGKIVAHVLAGHHAGLKDKLLGADERLDQKEASLGPIVRVAKSHGVVFPDTPPADLAALCIVNSRAHARELYDALKKAGLPGVRHLSTLMVPEHRSRVLKEIKDDLKCGRPCYVANTSLVEAGVDFSYPRRSMPPHAAPTTSENRPRPAHRRVACSGS